MEDNLQWKTTFNGKQPPIEENLQWKTNSSGRRPPIEDQLHLKGNIKNIYTANPSPMCHRGESWEILEEISSVALLSSACFGYFPSCCLSLPVATKYILFVINCPLFH